MTKKAYLGMPGYGSSISAFAAQSFWCASNDESLQVDRKYADGSLLAHVFNELWCWALNGRGVQYFAMQHADVEPQLGWLDVLIAELEEKELDVLSAVIPIKSDHGLTSTAVHRDGNNWRPRCRLTMLEVYDLPETFTKKDVGGDLLLNTGCWVCKFDKSWAEQVHFEINNRIVIGEDGSYAAEVEPEDWYFSRLCNEMNLRLGATRKIDIHHRGQTLYTNNEPWGMQRFDSHLTDKSVVPDPPIPFPYDIAGWMEPIEGYGLAELCKGKTVLEIGSYLGRSTICIARNAKEVHSVDPHDGRATPSPLQTHEMFLNNLKRYDIYNVKSFKGLVRDFEWDQIYDVVFIDGAHDYASVQDDIELAQSVLVDGGLIAFHDYKNGIDPGVERAVDEFLAAGATLLSTHGSVAIVRPPAAVLLET
jgi:hypothetical protein